MLSLDKENGSGGGVGRMKLADATPVKTMAAPLLASVSSTGKGLNLAGAAMIGATTTTTPKNNMTRMSAAGLTNTTGKRRALGDLINTAATVNRTANGINVGVGVTPKVDRGLGLLDKRLPMAECPGGRSQPNLVKKIAPAEPLYADLDDLEPVERFIGSKYDTFDDLFPEGRISEILMNGGKKVNFVVRLPHSSSSSSAKFDQENVHPMYDTTQHGVGKPHHNQMKAKLMKLEMEQTLVEFEVPQLDEPSLTDMLDELSL